MLLLAAGAVKLAPAVYYLCLPVLVFLAKWKGFHCNETDRVNVQRERLVRRVVEQLQKEALAVFTLSR